MDTTKYYQTYRIDHHPEGLTREEVAERGDVGATHDVLLFSMMHQPDGGLSTLVVTRRHGGDPLTPEEEFKAWTLLAHRLTQILPKGGRRDLCVATFEAVRAAVLGATGRSQEE